jgi:hypothetical protein
LTRESRIIAAPPVIPSLSHTVGTGVGFATQPVKEVLSKNAMSKRPDFFLDVERSIA